MFNKILLATSATDVSDHAARVAFNMVINYNAHLTILHIIGIPTRGFSHFVLDIKANTQVAIDDDYIEWVKEEIKDYYSRYLKKIKTYNIKVAIGHPYREILGSIRNDKPDIVILGGSTGNDSLYKKSTVGSTVHKITKLATCPVLLVNRPAASFWGGISNVVFVTDLSGETDTSFQFALKLVNRLNCEFHVFKVLDIRFNNLLQDEIDFKIREEMKVIRARYLPYIKESNCDNFSFNVWEGIPYVETVKYSRENNSDLIIIDNNYNNRNNKSRKIKGLGNNLEQIIVRSNCPVLSISNKIHEPK